MRKFSVAKTSGWTEEKVARLLASNNVAVENALLHLFKRQTASERKTEQTHNHNKIGFSAADASFYTRLAKRVLARRKEGAPKGKALTDREFAALRRNMKNGRPRIAKYSKQLLSVIAEKVANGEIVPMPGGRRNVPSSVDARRDSAERKWAEYKNLHARREVEQERAAYEHEMATQGV